MAGDTDNPRIWEGADFYVGDVGATAPTDVTSDWGADWDPIGLIDEDDGVVQTRDQDVNTHYAYGGILVRTTRSKHRRQIKVTALEDSALVFGLVNPGSTSDTAGGVTTRTVMVPVSDLRAFGAELRDGGITSRLIIPRGEVVEVGDQEAHDDNMTTYPLTIDIYPDADGVLFYELTDNPAAEDLAS